MEFAHAQQIWADHPALVAGAVAAHGIRVDAATTTAVDSRVAAFQKSARLRLGTRLESELPEIRAWRHTFARMGLKPTQYRCAAESLVRRFRKEGTLPRIHPLIDLCNAISLAFAIPVAVFDLAKVEGSLEVRHAVGDEEYLTFAGTTEHPEPDEVIFADAAGCAHARRWTNRQSGFSSVRETTTSVLIVAEAMHDAALSDVARLVDTLTDELHGVWSIAANAALLSRSSPRFEFTA